MTYKKLFKLIEGNFLKKCISFLYVNFTEYKPIYINLKKSSPLTIVHHHELRHRKDFDFFLKNLHEKVHNSSLVIFKRRFKFTFFFSGDKYYKFKNDVDSTYKNFLINSKRLLIFFPHMPASSIIQDLSLSNNQRFDVLQHGFYRHSKAQDLVFSESTKGENAYIFNNQYKFFFKNCKKVYVCGNYLIKQKKHCSLDINTTYIFHSLLQEHNFKEALDFVNRLKDSCIKIRHHPRTNFILKCKYWLGLKNKKFSLDFSKKDQIGSTNYFIDTSAWKDFTFPINSNIYLVDLPFLHIKKFKPDNLDNLSNKSFSNLVYRLSRYKK